MQQLAGLNSLRGAAALMIVIYHVWAIPNLPMGLFFKIVRDYMWLGVPLFFVVSAFSLALSTTSRVGGGDWVSAFAIRRFFRIAPLFYTVVLVRMAEVVLKGEPLPIAQILGTVSFLFNLMPGAHRSFVWAGWTIGVEMIFYGLVPYFLIFVKNFRDSLLVACFAIVLSVAFIHFYDTQPYPKDYVTKGFLSSIGIFINGFVALFAYVALRDSNRCRAIGLSMLWVFAVISAALVGLNPTSELLAPYRSLLWAPVFAVLIVSQCIHPVSWLANSAMSMLGRLSFGIYLCHPPVVFVLKPAYLKIYQLGLGNELAFVSCVLITLGCVVPLAIGANRWVEMPGIRLGERIIKVRGLRREVLGVSI